MMSYEGRNAEITVRNLLKSTYPEATTLSDLVRVSQSPDQGPSTCDATSQTTDRIYTFPIPIPMPITTECVTMGEPEVKESLKALGERWHARLGHTNDDSIKMTAKAYTHYCIPYKYHTDAKLQPEKCVCCQKCKASLKRKIPRSGTRACKYLERVHMDVCGPLQMKTTEGYTYFTVFYDEYTRYRWVYLHKDRTKSVEILRKFISDATKGTSRTIQCLCTDQAQEFLSQAYKDELEKHKIRIEYSCAYDKFQNGYAEKLIRDVCNMARCMLEYGSVARNMWGWAVRYAVYIQNRIVHRGMQVSPYEMQHQREPELDRLKVFCCTAYVS